MLQNTKIMTVVPVADLERARRFYGDTLGLKPAGESKAAGSVMFGTTEGMQVELMTRPNAIHDDHTLMSFEVDDVQRTLRDLEKRGVKFEDYDMPELKTQDHIATMDGEKAAWFKDSEGNILCIHQVMH